MLLTIKLKVTNGTNLYSLKSYDIITNFCDSKDELSKQFGNI